MSLPSFPDKENIPTRDEVINQIISSVAMEALGLSHVINAEGEKLQYALGTIPGVSGPDEPLTMEELLKLNESVHKTLNSTMMNQFFLKEKLVSALGASIMQGPQGPPGPITTILGSYDTLDDLIEEHPSGSPGDSYLVGGVLYIWDAENNTWKGTGDLTGPQGPQGTGTTIKDSYETKEEFEQNPPPGSLDDAYLVAGEIYIWNETDGWHSGGSLKGEKGDQGEQGEQGTGTTIKGSYETKDEFEQNPPPGSLDDAYLVEGEIYIWNETDGWHSGGSLKGEPGPPLEPSVTLFSIVDPDDNEEDVCYDESLNFESETLSISVESGPVVKIENPNAHAGAIIPFASNSNITIDTEILGGRRNTTALLGFGSGGQFDAPPELSASFTLPEGIMENGHFYFPMPTDGKITSIALTCSAYAGSISGVTNIITARLYYSDTPDNVFTPLEGATVSVSISESIVSTQFRSNINDELSIPVAAGTRLLFLIDTTTPDYTGSTLITAHWSGSIKIE